MMGSGRGKVAGGGAADASTARCQCAMVRVSSIDAPGGAGVVALMVPS